MPEYCCPECRSYAVNLVDSRIFKFLCDDCEHIWCLDISKILEFKKIIRDAPAREERH